MNEKRNANDVDSFLTTYHLYVKIITFRLKELGMKMERVKVFG